MTHTVTELLRSGTEALEQASESARLDAELLLGRLLGVSRAGLAARGDEPVAAGRAQDYRRLIERRLDGAPVAYLTGVREFWSLPLAVSPAVLVPRPETELLVELALATLPAGQPASVLDLGTGSGAIAIALAHERPRDRIVAVDVSPAALEVARSNAERLGLPGIEWRLGSWLEAVPSERFDLIVSNPPYVAAADPALASLAAEPRLALSPGPSGLEALAAIVDAAPRHLAGAGWLLLEHGERQGADVRGLLERRGFASIRTQDDLSAKPRVTLGRLNSHSKETP
jgi:release factor glutamine methyltransferase